MSAPPASPPAHAIPWYYLGDTFWGLSRSSSITDRADDCPGVTQEARSAVAEELLKLDGPALKETLLSPKGTDGEGGWPSVLAIIRGLANKRRKNTGRHIWGHWPRGVAVQVRRNLPQPHEIILERDRVTLPWPFLGLDQATRDTLENRAGEYIPTWTGGKDGVYVDALFWTADQIVKADPDAVRHLRGIRGDSDKVRSFLLEYAHGRDLGYLKLPDSMRVSVEFNDSESTMIASEAGRLHLKLGLAEEDGPHTEFSPWPCGGG